MPLLTLIVCGTLAATAWYATTLLDGRLLIIPVGLLALVLTFIAFPFARQLLVPGPRVAVHERVLVTGRRAFAWTDISRIEYHHTFARTEDRTVHHTWTLHLQDGRQHVFAATEDLAGCHIDVVELGRFLHEHHANYIDLHAPRVESDRTSDGIAARKRVITLPAAAAAAVLELKERRADRSRVMGALARGVHRRSAERQKAVFHSVANGLGQQAVAGTIAVLGLAAVLCLIVFLGSGCDAVFARITPLSREFDSLLVDRVGARMPAFALANVKAASPPANLHTLVVTDDEWTTVADALIQEARLVILHLEGATPGILRELIVADVIGAHDRTLLIRSPRLLDSASPELESLLGRYRHHSEIDIGSIESEIERILD